MHKYWKQIAAGSLAVMLATPVPIQAAIKKSIYVGDVVSITAADLKVNKGYKSLSELNTIYSEAREKVGSAYSSIESGNTIRILTEMQPEVVLEVTDQAAH